MKKPKIEIIERHIKLNGKKIKEGNLVSFKYGKRKEKFKGYFYIADMPNRILGADFLISDKKKKDWKWSDGYSQGFNINQVKNFRILKEN